jgi:ankyrin repeat protein
VCAVNNEYDCALLLLEANCEVDCKNKSGKSPLMLAASYNSFSIMELLLTNKTKKVDLNCVDSNGNSCLHLALLNKHENCALYILDKIEPNSHLINLRNKEGNTLLHMAASVGYLTCVEILLSKGADIWLKNFKQKHTPLVMCAKNEQVADCLELMLSRLILMITNGSMNGVNATVASNKTTSNLMMMMMTPSNNQNLTPAQVLANKNKNENLESSYTCLKDIETDAITNEPKTHNSVKESPNRHHDLNNEFKISNCIRLHNEATNLNSTLILTENELMDENEIDEEILAGEKCEDEKQVTDSLDVHLLTKIAPLPSSDDIDIGKRKIAIEFFNENLSSNEFSSDSNEFY